MFDVIGDWNPQLLRELKGQLQPLKILVAIAIAIIGQIIFLAIMIGSLPGTVSPTDLVVTTYPDINLAYDSSNDSQPFRIESLYYKVPLEYTPGQDFLTQSPTLKQNDHIMAVDGVPLILGQDQSPGYDQEILKKEIVKPFAEDISDLATSSVPSISMAAMARLRQTIPGTSVTLTVEKSDGQVVDVTLPRIIHSHRYTPYCLVPDGWNELSQSQQSSDRYASPPSDQISHYQKSCQVAQGEHEYRIDWTRWHQDAFWALSLATVFPLFILGGYSIINNLLKEERDGTFNFIRLSPRSAWDILGGKIMGVPALIYGAVLLTLPLNLFHGLMGEVPIGMLFSFYGATVLLTFLTFSFAVLFGLIRMGIGVIQAWLGAGAIFLVQLLCLQVSRFAEELNNIDLFVWGFLFSPFSMLRPMGHEPFIDSSIADYYAVVDPSFSWFGMPLVPLMIFVLLGGNSVVLGHWLWKALGRRFFMPTGTIISKAQSYGLTLFFNLCLVGFSWRSVDSAKTFSNWGQDHLMVFAIAQMLLWVLLVIALAPQQQSLQDWTRYRHRMPTLLSAPQASTHQAADLQGHTQAQRLLIGRPLSLWTDLVWGEKSPVVVAIALNLLINLGFTLVWLLHHLLMVREINVWGWMLSTTMVLMAANLVILIGTTLVQFVFLYRQHYAIVISVALLAILILGPPIALSILGVYESGYPNVWLAVFPWATIPHFIPKFAFSTKVMLESFTVLAVQGGFLGYAELAF